MSWYQALISIIEFQKSFLKTLKYPLESVLRKCVQELLKMKNLSNSIHDFIFIKLTGNEPRKLLVRYFLPTFRVSPDKIDIPFQLSIYQVIFVNLKNLISHCFSTFSSFHKLQLCLSIDKFSILRHQDQNNQKGLSPFIPIHLLIVFH